MVINKYLLTKKSISFLTGIYFQASRIPVTNKLYQEQFRFVTNYKERRRFSIRFYFFVYLVIFGSTFVKAFIMLLKGKQLMIPIDII